MVDRTTGILSSGAWNTNVNSRAAVASTVQIDMTSSYDETTRILTADIDFTALQNLSGDYRYSMVLVEDSLVGYQAGQGNNYIHKNVVRAMMNGATGAQISSGAWNQGNMITKNFNYTIPVPPGGDIIPEKCHIVVLVYKYGSPLNSSAEMQQAKKVPLVTPDFVATIAQCSPDFIGSNTTVAQMEAVIYNRGLQDDTYYLDLQQIAGPAGWSLEYTIPSGTFPLGHIDTVAVVAGDSAVITISVNPNGIDGAGIANLEFASKNKPGLYGRVKMRNVTTTGLDILVIDANTGAHVEYLTDTMDRLNVSSYGVVSRTAIADPAADLGNYKQIFWSAGESKKAFHLTEMNHLKNFMDAGGDALFMGQDIGSDIFGANATSTYAQSFYNNYLHANFVSDASPMFLVKGVAGDPISDGMQFILGSVYDRSLDILSPAGSAATGCFMYWSAPSWGAIHAETSLYRMIYMSFGIEQIDQIATRDTLLSRSMNWLNAAPTGIANAENKIQHYELNQNYPNPFNPLTTIKYTLSHPGMVNTQLNIYNSLGQKIRTMVNEPQAADVYELQWDGTDAAGNSVASGIYYYQLKSGDFNSVKKMIFMK